MMFATLAASLLAISTTAQQPDTWAFEPEADTYDPAAWLDLRTLNEDVAGQSGFVTLSDDGMSFVRGDGEPIRFWALTTYTFRQDQEALEDHARFLAKRGVNMVRFHGSFQPRQEGADLEDVDTNERDQLWRLVAAMKEEGIYVTASAYFALTFGDISDFGYDADTAHNVLFFDERLRNAYRSWLRQIFLPENPYTGIPLKDDPAIALFQIQNEDSLLFWTFDSMEGPIRQEAREQYADWLTAKYGSMAAAYEAWGGMLDGDEPELPDFRNTWETTQRARPVRTGDELEFRATVMRDFNQEIETFLREEIGLKCLVNAGNWKTADPATMEDVERWTYTPNQVMAVNRYFGGLHEGPNNGWAIVEGDRLRSNSVLMNPLEMPTNIRQPVGYPFLVTESLWVPPTEYQSEGPLLTAAYQSLTGVDAFYWFSTGVAQWRQPSSANGFLDSIGKWQLATPEILGNFPAAAWIYRNGLVQEGEPVLVERRSMDDLWTRTEPLVVENRSFDPNRDSEFVTRESPIQTPLDPLAFLVGPVMVEFDADPSKTQAMNLEPFVDRERGIVTSNTGELELNSERRHFSIDAPQVQAVSGWLAEAGAAKLSDVTIESDSEYATVAVVALDDRPLNETQRALVQIGTTARPTGWQTREVQTDAGTVEEIVAHGTAPWRIQRFDGTLVIENPGLRKATVLDMNFMPIGEIQPEFDSGRMSIRLPEDAKYVMLTP